MSLHVVPFPDFPRWIEDVVLDGRLFTLRGSWNVRYKSWFIGIDSAEGERLLAGTRVVFNWPLLRGFQSDSRLPQGFLFVTCPAGDCRHDPTRYDFRDGRLVLMYETSQ